VDVSLAELAREGVDFAYVDVPFMVYTAGKARLEIGGIHLAAGPRDD